MPISTQNVAHQTHLSVNLFLSQNHVLEPKTTLYTLFFGIKCVNSTSRLSLILIYPPSVITRLLRVSSTDCPIWFHPLITCHSYR